MMTGQPIKRLQLVDDAPERLEKRQGVDDDEEEEEGRAQPEQALGGRAGGVDEGRAQAVEEDRRRERSLQVGEEVDDVEPALNQMAQIVGGEGHGFGRALLAVGDQVADDRQTPDQREIEQTEIAVDGPNERRAGAVDEPFRRHLDQALDDLLNGNLTTVVLVDRFVDFGSRQGRRSGPCRSRMTRSASCRRWSRSSRASIAPLACSSSLRNVTSRWRSLDSDFLRLQGLEQDDVAIEQPGHAANQAIAQPQEDERHAHQPEDRQRHPDEPERDAPDADQSAGTARMTARPDGRVLQLFRAI